MNRPLVHLLLLALLLIPFNCCASESQQSKTDGPVSPIVPSGQNHLRYPRIVLYSVSWCPHCREVKEYLKTHNIPFINRDVEMDEAARTELLEKYKFDRVPLIVLGNDEKILKGFSRESFEKILEEMGGEKSH